MIENLMLCEPWNNKVGAGIPSRRGGIGKNERRMQLPYDKGQCQQDKKSIDDICFLIAGQITDAAYQGWHPSIMPDIVRQRYAPFKYCLVTGLYLVDPEQSYKRNRVEGTVRKHAGP